MGCKQSKVVSESGYGMGTAPRYQGIKKSAGREVAIFWDMDDVSCPPNNELSLRFLNALHEVSNGLHGKYETVSL
jgi:hypothetical protein